MKNIIFIKQIELEFDLELMKSYIFLYAEVYSRSNPSDTDFFGFFITLIFPFCNFIF